MNYLKQINLYWLASRNLPDAKPYHHCLYYALLHINNLSGWKPVFRVDFNSIINMTGMDKNTYYKACEYLHANGFISLYKKGINKTEQARFSLRELSDISESERNVEGMQAEGKRNILKHINIKPKNKETCLQPTILEIFDFFKLKGIDDKEATKFFNYNESKNWKGIADWKPMAENWILNSNNKTTNNYESSRADRKNSTRYHVGEQDYSTKFQR